MILSPESSFCADSYRYPFHPHNTTVTSKNSRSVFFLLFSHFLSLVCKQFLKGVLYSLAIKTQPTRSNSSKRVRYSLMRQDPVLSLLQSRIHSLSVSVSLSLCLSVCLCLCLSLRARARARVCVQRIRTLVFNVKRLVRQDRRSEGATSLTTV